MSAAAVMTTAPAGVYLSSYLEPFQKILSRSDVTDVYVNQPGELWVETVGGCIERHENRALTELTLARLIRQVAALTHQGVNREHPLLGATLPDGSRLQIVGPPATRGPLALAIRRQVAHAMTLADYSVSGQFENTRTSACAAADDRKLRALIAARKFSEALELAVRTRRNIIVSGGTSSGKTTFLNALLREVPREERIILIEDTPELNVDHPNFVGLVSVRDRLGEAKVTTDDLLSASLRMRPDRIILGELRGGEALAFLRAVNTGHPGSMTTVHADSPESAVEQLVLLVLQAGSRLSRADVKHYITHSVDLFVHLSRAGGARSVEALTLNETVGGL